jgi:hypothetical protein
LRHVFALQSNLMLTEYGLLRKIISSPISFEIKYHLCLMPFWTCGPGQMFHLPPLSDRPCARRQYRNGYMNMPKYGNNRFPSVTHWEWEEASLCRIKSNLFNPLKMKLV